MVEQSSIKFAAGTIVLLLLVPIVTGTTIQKAEAEAAAGIMVPLYPYPGGTWDTVIETKNDHPGVPIVAIGGVTLDTARSAIEAGAAAVAVISDLLRGGDPEARVKAYLRALS